MTARSRHWLAVAVGLWIAQGLPAQEPARLAVEPASPLHTPAPASANQQLANAIGEHLHQNANLRHYTLHVSYKDGSAEISGAVTDQAQRDEVVRIVQGIPGVERVHDHLLLTGPIAQTQGVDPPPQQEPPLVGPPQTPAPEQPPAPRVAPPDGAPGAPPAAGNEPMPLYQAAPSPYDLNPPRMPPYAWPTYAPYNNVSRVAYPNFYPYQSWPFIGPVYPYPKIPLSWRKTQLEWQDGKWWYSTRSNSYDWWRLRYW